MSVLRGSREERAEHPKIEHAFDDVELEFLNTVKMVTRYMMAPGYPENDAANAQEAMKKLSGAIDAHVKAWKVWWDTTQSSGKSGGVLLQHEVAL